MGRPKAAISVYQESISAIKAIPICPRVQQDKWIWTKTNNGADSVKSTYWAILELGY